MIMANNKEINIEVEETNLEDLIVLGDSKLINILINYPNEDTGEMEKTRTKIKQLTMKELRNINLNNITYETNVKILEKCLYKQDETRFSKELISYLPVGVANAITEEILRISGVELKKEF